MIICYEGEVDQETSTIFTKLSVHDQQSRVSCFTCKEQNVEQAAEQYPYLFIICTKPHPL